LPVRYSVGMHTLRNPKDCQDILVRLQCICPDTPRGWGRMSAPQMICHLRDGFLGVMGDVPMSQPSGFSWWRLTKPFAIYAPVEWPQGVPTRPEFDQLAGTARPPAEFTADVQGLLDAIERFSAQPRAFAFRPHPLFGNLSEKEWMIWGYRHADHHLRQFGN